MSNQSDVADQRVGVIEIGSRYVRYVVGRFSPDGSFKKLNPHQPYKHEIDINNLDQDKVNMLWSKVAEFESDLQRQKFSEKYKLVCGTELCRQLSNVPSNVTLLSPSDEGLASWTAGFLTAYRRKRQGRFTVVDQGGGSMEIVSANWVGAIERRMSDTFPELGSGRMAKVYAQIGHKFLEAVPAFLKVHDDEIERHRASELILLGSAATKIAFNKKHKRNDEDDYDPRRTDGTRLSLGDIEEYYTFIAEEYRKDPMRARNLVDRRTVNTNEYEIVMSGAVLLMQLARRLGHDQVTVSSKGTTVGLSFLRMAGIL